MDKKEIIYEFMSDKIYTPMNFRQLCAVLCVPKNEKNNFMNLLLQLEQDGKIYKNAKNKYSVSAGSGIIKGEFRSSGNRFGFLTDEDGNKFFVSPSDTLNAFNNDTVLAKITKKSRTADKCSECKIIKILSHSDTLIVGKYIKERNFGFVIADDKAFGSDIYIPKSKNIGAKNNSKVTVKITNWPEKGKNPEGEITEILGKAGDYAADIKSIVRKFGIDENWPEKVENQIEGIKDSISEAEIRDRRDFRQNITFTIDGDDSKDFDDAVSLETHDDGYRLGVHIADVTHYVTENTPLDIEARRRGTSVYLPGYVIPMLPKKLSNGLCSLNPDCERLTLSVIMDFDKDGKIKDHEICKSVIKSKYRMTYNDTSAILDGDKDLCTKYSEITEILSDMNNLAKTLKRNRLEKGSIDFDFPEIKIAVDENGEAIDVYKAKPTQAHSLIEEFMLAANKCVAEDMFWCDIPFIFRVHEKPSADKIKTFNKFISFFGYRLKGKAENVHPKNFADLLNKIKNTDKELMISKMMLRSLMKARYSEECIGHFGLDFKYYCHFTSPIRRYPDLVIHRIIKEYLTSGLNEKRSEYLSEFVKKAAKSSSEAEITAMEAERDADDMMKAKYMQRFIGEQFDAVVASVTSFGLFAQIPSGIEGLISMTDLDDDYYDYNDKNMTLTGRKYGKVFSVGDKLRITVKRADPQTKEIDYIIENGDLNE
ncbi:MAG: ribonuclease R [Clostridia bacterium]|nr:ribonuclease R [Clostridia bacterium]